MENVVRLNGSQGRVERLIAQVQAHLDTVILPYWSSKVVRADGNGFYGLITATEIADPDAPMGSILMSRILWTFATVAQDRPTNHRYAALARLAFNQLKRLHIDPVHGGVYWSSSPDGSPLESHKHSYAQAFAIYGLTAYYNLTREPEALRLALHTFQLLERHAHDVAHGGYLEARLRDWSPRSDGRLSERDAASPKSTNTNLHILEAYTALLKTTANAEVAFALEQLLGIFTTRIVRPNGHCDTFFSKSWTPEHSHVSYGHDIEAMWLMLDAAEALECHGSTPSHLSTVTQLIPIMAEATRREGMGQDGGIHYEITHEGVLDTDKHWWPQAEAAVGFIVAFLETGREDYLTAAEAVWHYIETHLVDPIHGEWYARLDDNHRRYPNEAKVDPWKCPYHNARACLEIEKRLTKALIHQETSTNA